MSENELESDEISILSTCTSITIKFKTFEPILRSFNPNHMINQTSQSSLYENLDEIIEMFQKESAQFQKESSEMIQKIQKESDERIQKIQKESADMIQEIRKESAERIENAQNHVMRLLGEVSKLQLRVKMLERENEIFKEEKKSLMEQGYQTHQAKSGFRRSSMSREGDIYSSLRTPSYSSVDRKIVHQEGLLSDAKAQKSAFGFSKRFLRPSRSRKGSVKTEQVGPSESKHENESGKIFFS